MDEAVAMFPKIHYYRIHILSVGSALKCRNRQKVNEEREEVWSAELV